MPRRVQDIIPSGRRSIRDIPIHESEQRASRTTEKEVEIKIHKPQRDRPVSNLISIEPEDQKKTPRRKKKRGSGMKMVLFFLGSVVTIAVIGYFASQMYAIARFDIVPVSYPVHINKTIVSQANPTKDEVGYAIITLSDSASVDSPSTDGAYQESKAGGKVIIYNEYSSATQRLVAGTRLATPKGTIYKLTTSVTVPGKSAKGPGQVTATVIADKAGQEYNLPASEGVTLRLLGFQGTPKYEDFYAKLSTSIQGGFAGTKKNIAKADLASSTAYLERKLLAELSAKANSEIDTEHILFDEGLLFSTSTISIADKDAHSSTLTLTATMHGIVFEKKSLFSKLAGEDIVDRFDGYDFDIRGIDTLKVVFTNLKDFSVQRKNSLLANIEGDVTLVARIPIDEIKSKLIGLPLSETYKVIRSYAPIISTESRGQVMPPWSNIPTRPDNIEIHIEESK